GSPPRHRRPRRETHPPRAPRRRHHGLPRRERARRRLGGQAGLLSGHPRPHTERRDRGRRRESLPGRPPPRHREARPWPRRGAFLPGRPPGHRGGPLPPPIIDAEFSEAPRHLREHLWVLHKYRWLAATCFGLTFGLTVFATLLTPRLYTASTRLELARQSPIQLRLEGNVLRLGDGDLSANGAATFLSTQVAALQSRDLAERVIRSRGLADSEAFLDPGPRRRGRLSLSGTTLRLLRPRGLETGPAGPSEDGSAGRGAVDPALIDRYMRYLSVQEIRGTDLVAVRFTTPSPSLSAFLAAAHTQAYLEADEEARRADDVTAKEFLGRQLRESREHAERAEAALSRFAAEHPNVAINEEQKTVAQRISDVSSLLSKAEGTRLALHSRYDFLTRPDGDALAYFLG